MRSMSETPPPAPGAELYPSLDLANSALSMPNGERDLLDSPGAATRWLVDRGLAPVGSLLQEVCAGRLRGLRDDVRALLAAQVTGTAPPADALRAINHALTRAPSAEELHWDETHGLHRAPAHPTDQVIEYALAVLAADAAEMLTGPVVDRLTACGSPPCRRYLVRTHAARHWCSVRCGDRARAARAYARRKTD
ncbi:CGNR zinc finger domain-containing protein [Micromonosporaceae bacterium Da 78-11]